MSTAFNDHFDSGYDQAAALLLAMGDDGEAFCRLMAESLQAGVLSALGIEATPEQAEALRGWASGFAYRSGTTTFVLAHSREVTPKPDQSSFH